MGRFIFVSLIALSALSASAAVHTAENGTLAVNYDDVRKTFSVVEKASGKAFIPEGRLEPATALKQGEIWPDDKGVHINAHSAGILVHDGVFYWYGEHKIEGGAGNLAHVGVHVYSSRDLRNWKDEGIALKVSDDPKSDIAKGRVIERPKVIFNKKTGKFVMWFHLELDTGYAAARSGVAVADSPVGPFTFIESFRPNAGVWPLNVPKAFQKPLSPEEADRVARSEMSGSHMADYCRQDYRILRRDFVGGQMARDMNLFVDDDGKAYHIYASEGNSTLHISLLSDDYLKPAGRYVRVFPMAYNEAPAIMKHRGKYYMISSGCTGWAPNAARSAVADSLFGPWKELGNPCVGVNPRMKLGPEKTFGGQSTFILPLPGRPGSFVALFDQWRPGNAIDGRYFWLPVRFEGEGFKVDWTDEWNPVLGRGGATAHSEAARDPVFGKGRRIVVPQTDGSTALELYRGLPFLFIRKTLANGGAAATDLQRVVPATFTLDLGKPADALRTMGTGGLTAPDKHSGSYVFLTCADPATRRGVVAGWVSHDRGDGVVFSSVADGQVAFKAQLDYGHLRIQPGKSERLETLAVGLFDDARLGEEQFADAIKRQYAITLRPRVGGYCTWYSEVGGMGDKTNGAGASNERDIITLAEFASRELKPFGFGLVQIDDEWQDGGNYNGPRRGFDRVKPGGPYPHGMKPVAETINRLGMTAGIWFMPFARNHQDPEYKDRQHWFTKRLNGKPYETEWGGTSLDLSHPEVQAHLDSLVRTIHGWGYTYFKMDGLWTGSSTEQIYVNDGYKDDTIGNHQPFHNPDKTNIENLRDGLKLIRKAAGPEVFFSGCNVSQNMRTLGGTMGLLDAMRIGPDNGQSWEEIIRGPIRGSRLYFLNGRVWWNDPDPCYVRDSIPLAHAQVITSWISLSGAFWLNSDWMPKLSAERLNLLRRTLPAHNATARPVDYFERDVPCIWLVSDARPDAVRRDVLGLFNWESRPVALEYAATRAGLDAAATYYAFDFWANRLVPGFAGKFSFDLPAQSCRVIAVRAAEGHPVLLSTSRHVTQGMVDVLEEKWNRDALAGLSRVVGNDPYELRIAGTLEGGRQWKVAKVELSAADQAAGVTAEFRAEPGLVRVSLKSPASRDVRWRVVFNE
jgi:hypothetical protein